MRRVVRLRVNGAPVEVLARPDRVLLDVLRDDLGLTGTKSDCGMGVCGTCTVLVDGRPASSCLLLACLADGREVITIEGLGGPTTLDPVQAAFAEVGAFECGFCTTGMIVTARALLDHVPAPGRQTIVEFMSGNLCRCTGYADIVRAIERAASRGASAPARGAAAPPRGAPAPPRGAPAPPRGAAAPPRGAAAPPRGAAAPPRGAPAPPRGAAAPPSGASA